MGRRRQSENVIAERVLKDNGNGRAGQFQFSPGAEDGDSVERHGHVAINQIMRDRFGGTFELAGDAAAQGMAAAVCVNGKPGVALAGITPGVGLDFNDQDAGGAEDKQVHVALARTGSDKVCHCRVAVRQAAQGMQHGLLTFRASVPAVEVPQGANACLHPAEAEKRGSGKPVAAKVGGLGPEQQAAPDPANGQRSFNPHDFIGMARVPNDFHGLIIGCDTNKD